MDLEINNAEVGIAAKSIFFGAITAGTLDITYAMTAAAARDRPPLRAVEAVASGVLGASAFDGGKAIIFLGLLLHYSILYVAATIYFAVSTRIALLRERILLSATLFGVLLYLSMNFAVLPLSAVPFKISYPPASLAIGVLVHIFLVGLPIAYFTSRSWTGFKKRLSPV